MIEETKLLEKNEVCTIDFETQRRDFLSQEKKLFERLEINALAILKKKED